MSTFGVLIWNRSFFPYHLVLTAREDVYKRQDQPYVIVQTQSENGSFCSNRVPRFDSDVPGNLCRLYAIPGATHDLSLIHI